MPSTTEICTMLICSNAKLVCFPYVWFPLRTIIRIKGSIVTIASNSQDITGLIADQINKGYFTPPLDVYIFYSSSQKSLQSRWCVGLDITNASKLIDLLNRQNPLINADTSPQNWSDKNGSSYSVVMLTGVLEQEQSEELKKRVNLCLAAIQNVTALL